jgi:hypothetical protein
MGTGYNMHEASFGSRMVPGNRALLCIVMQGALVRSYAGSVKCQYVRRNSVEVVDSFTFNSKVQNADLH